MVVVLLLLMVALFTFLFSYDFCFYLYFLFLSVRFIFFRWLPMHMLKSFAIAVGASCGRGGMCDEEAKQNPQMDIKYNVQFREESCIGMNLL